TFLLVCRAYERMRGAPAEGFLVAAEPASDVPPATLPPAVAEPGGVPVEPLRAAASAPYSELTISDGVPSSSYDDELTFTTTNRTRARRAEALFEEGGAPGGTGRAPSSPAASSRAAAEPAAPEATPPGQDITPAEAAPAARIEAAASPPSTVDDG